MKQLRLSMACILLGAYALAPAQATDLDAPKRCDRCEEWNRAVEPFKIFGNTYYVGTRLSSVLITSDQGHVLIDGALPQSAPLIAASIRKLGFDPADVKLIVNSHTHYDHAGGIAALQKLTGAPIAASPRAAEALRQGQPVSDDPQAAFGFATNGFPAASNVRVVADRDTVRVGEIVVTAQFTPGHTPGGTTWTWQSCEETRCLDVVYADSLTAVSAPQYRFKDHPETLNALRRSIERFSKLPCDVMISPHPEQSRLFERRAAAPKSADAFIDAAACINYAKAATATLERRLAEESRAR